ncbi:MAG: CDP-alcohol phosphatidyltransferase family protein [Candidatus Marinimicrobia bacterium]|nr:CDP-alcohol phosphatidyltransferase family protein [Candidatus Neomarinimicrobiota bacterium]
MTYFNTANSISISRIFMTIPSFMLFDSGNKYWGLLVLILIIITDYADGIAARRLNQVSDFGKALDPVADKIVIISLFIYLLIKSDFPIWYLASLISRDLVLSYLSLLVKRRSGIMPQTNVPGKIAINFIALMVIAWFMEWEDVKMFGLWSSTIFLIFSTVVYLREYYNILYKKVSVEN